MSSSQYLGALIVPSLGETFYFNTVRTKNGWPEEDQVLIEQEIMSMGVDGSRFREVNWQWPEWEFRTLTDYAAWDDGVADKRDMIASMKAIDCTFRKYVRGTLYIFENLKVINVVPELKAGAAVGYGAVANSSAIILASWTVKFLDTPR